MNQAHMDQAFAYAVGRHQTPATVVSRATDQQVGGDHYRSMAIQPIEFIHKNHIGFIEGLAIKYIVRHRTKAGRVDIEKAIHTLQILLQMDYPQ